MAETRTVALTDAERVNLLLDENQRLRDELSAAAVLGEVFAREAAATDSMRKIDRAGLEIAAANLSPALAANDALREALKKAERERVDAQVMQYAADAECEQLRRELAALSDDPSAQVIDMPSDLGPDRRSCTFTLSRLVGVAIGAGLVGVVAGASVAAEIVGRLPW